MAINNYGSEQNRKRHLPNDVTSTIWMTVCVAAMHYIWELKPSDKISECDASVYGLDSFLALFQHCG
ncbi:hybrid sensor histidine kinase/response regulator [Sesbania bispinosa]|nr:hybrid sensor histidine kinase/response regulator [Sesbania bispinosa]